MRRAHWAAALAFVLTPLAAWGQAFTPNLDGTQSTVAVAASTSNATGTLTPPTSAVYQIRIYNACSTTAFLKFGGAATTSDMPVPAGVVEVITIASTFTSVGVILASGSGCSVYFTMGRGI